MTIAFCSVLRFAVGSDFGSKRIFKPGTTAVIVSILFTIFLFTAKDSLFSNWDQPSLARLVCAAPFVLSLGILVSVTTFTVVFGNRLRGNGCKKTTLVLFMIGCIGLMWHSVNVLP